MKTKNKALKLAAGILNCLIAVLIMVIFVRLCIIIFRDINLVVAMFLLPFISLPIIYTVLIILGVPLALNAAGGIGALVCSKINTVNGFLITSIVATCVNLPMSLLIIALTSSVIVYCAVFVILAFSFISLGLSIAALALNKVRADNNEIPAEDKDGKEQE